MKDALHGQPTQDFTPPKSSTDETKPTANPYDTSSGVAPAPPISATDGPQFPAFNTGPDSYTPPPSPTPTPTPTGTAKPAQVKAQSIRKSSAECTDDPTKQTKAVPFDAACTHDGHLPRHH
jgi:hypothetical protein